MAFSPSLAGAQTPYFVPPAGAGTPVDFVACPERTGGGSWVATDASTGFTYSLAGAAPPPPDLVVRVSGVVSPQLIDVPGWALTPIKVIVGRQPCRSAGVYRPANFGTVPAGPLFPFLPRF